jgi:hypothetical protein
MAIITEDEIEKIKKTILSLRTIANQYAVKLRETDGQADESVVNAIDDANARIDDLNRLIH